MAKQNEITLKSAETVEVLYQKLGDRWFAFSLIGEDVFVGSITQDEIDQVEQMKATPNHDKVHKVSGNS